MKSRKVFKNSGGSPSTTFTDSSALPQKDGGGAVRATNSHRGLRKSGAGFTLIEVLIVIGLLGLVASLGSAVGFDTLGRSAVREERDTLVSLLWSARTRALANMHESAQGVHIDGGQYVLFEGASYDISDPDNQVIPRNPAVSISGGPDIIFVQLSGDASTGIGTLTMTGPTGAATVVINEAGRIEW